MKPLNVLIVDDSATMRQFVRRAVLLSEVPIASVLEAANDREALAMLDADEIDARFAWSKRGAANCSSPAPPMRRPVNITSSFARVESIC
jgi:hypothetical protein